MKELNLMKKGNKKFALFSILFLILSCSNENDTKANSTENMANVEQTKSISQEELQKYTKNAVQTQDAFVSVHNSVKD